jgi:hypothetical protein
MRLNIGHEDAIVSVITPSGEEIRPMTQAEVDSHNSEYDLYEKWVAEEKYKEDRKLEYDKLNQFEMQFDDQRDGTTTWVDAINGIKDKYPKE